MSDAIMQNAIAESAHDVMSAAQPGQFLQIRNAKELAAVSQYAQNNGMYDARFEDALAYHLHHSRAQGIYRMTSQVTPPPANLVQSLRSRV